MLLVSILLTTDYILLRNGQLELNSSDLGPRYSYSNTGAFVPFYLCCICLSDQVQYSHIVN